MRPKKKKKHTKRKAATVLRGLFRKEYEANSFLINILGMLYKEKYDLHSM